MIKMMMRTITTVMTMPVMSPVLSLIAAAAGDRVLASILTGPPPAVRSSQKQVSYAVVTCDIKLSQNYFSLRQRPSEIILFQCVETCLKLFQKITAAHEYFPTCLLPLK